ncbi:Maf family protein [Halopseudomonas salegens]|uniref:dTTP/UTP pyrophosphatase n=1 Tax=Halopseudomonas salegens TaxID=1434072 RepID=A0A1H2GL48_9GAMM|nr:Maf family protein [Halopseudomonas salegens]SDU20171.1 septum formation protein [Halopseudomonas salegens]
MSTEALVYLASASPRRRELLAQIGVPCIQAATDIDERVLPGELAADYVQRIARAKVLAGVKSAPPDAVVLAADTVVVVDEQILGKPADAGDGARMLGLLAARSHQVMTAVSVARGTQLNDSLVSTRVSFRTITAREMAAYWQTGEPQDKAGGYAIQGLGAVFVTGIEGSYSAVVGLPLRETADLLAHFGVSCWQSV